MQQKAEKEKRELAKKARKHKNRVSLLEKENNELKKSLESSRQRVKTLEKEAVAGVTSDAELEDLRDLETMRDHRWSTKKEAHADHTTPGGPAYPNLDADAYV